MDFKNAEYEGKGKYVYPSGANYEGDYKNDYKKRKGKNTFMQMKISMKVIGKIVTKKEKEECTIYLMGRLIKLRKGYIKMIRKKENF